MKQNEKGDFRMKITVFKYGEALYKAANLFADREGDGKVPLAFCFYLIETGTQKIMVDTGCDGRERYGFYTYRAPVEMLADYGLRPEQITDVVITHAHFDHMLYAKPWLDQGARLYVHANDAAALADPSLNLSTMVNCRLALPQADVLLAEGDVVTEAGAELQVLHTPGHTPGGVCYLCGKDLFSGDTLFYKDCGRTDLAGGDGRVLRNSLSRLMTLDEQIVVYPGHGMKTKIAWERGTRF